MKIRKPPEWGITPVPNSQRLLRSIDLAVFWTSLGTGLLVYQAGALLVPYLDFLTSFAVITVGTIVGTLPLALAGMIGGRCGVPTMVSLRPSFGIRGSYFPTWLNVVQLIGWGALEIVVMAKAGDLISSTTAGFSAYWLWVIVFTFFTIVMGIGGPLIVVKQWLERFAFWLLYGSAAWVTFWALQKGGLQKVMGAEAEGGLPLLLALDLVIAMPLSWMPLAADYNRFASTAKGGFLGTYLGFVVGNISGYTIGSILILATGSSDIVGSFGYLFLGAPALLLILVYELDNCFADVYSAAVSVQNNLPKIKQWVLIVLIGGVCAALALFIDIENYVWFLLWIGATFSPIFGVVLSDYYILSKQRIDVEQLYVREGSYWYTKGVNISAMISWAAGFITYITITTHLAWLGATIPSMITAAAFNTILSRGVKREQVVAEV
ncbi:MAG: purine-cytosine permease family protein [Nitrososphaerales archaeon]